MCINDILSILEELGVESDELTPESTLGDDAAMDSQEIVELRGLIAERFGAEIPAKTIGKKSSLAEVLTAAHAAAGVEAPPTSVEAPPASAGSAFDGTLETSLDIECDVDTAYKALFELDAWTGHLPHVDGITVLYDDGTFQEFLMEVASPAGQIHVRSIRRCRADQIEFFQPEPPRFLRHHSGGWRFESLSAGRCRVTTYHRWNLAPEAARQAFPPGATTTERQVEALLLEHAKFALSTWKNRIEGGHVVAGAPLRRAS